jgi:hypothetical protein
MTNAQVRRRGRRGFWHWLLRDKRQPFEIVMLDHGTYFTAGTVMRQQLCQLWCSFVLADKELQVCVYVCVCVLFLVMRQQLCQLWCLFLLADKELQVRVCVCVLFLVMRQQLCQLWCLFVLADKELQVRVSVCMYVCMCVCVCVCVLFISDAPAAVSAVVPVCAGRQGVAGACVCMCVCVCSF